MQSGRFHRSFLLPRYWLSWLGVAMLWLLSLMPDHWRHGLGNYLGKQMYLRNRKRRQIVLTNLQLCFPEQSDEQRTQLAIEHFQYYLCGMLDYSLYFFASKKRLYKRIHFDPSVFQSSIDKGKPIIALLAHSPLLDFAPVALGQHFFTYCSYKPFSNAIFDWLIYRGRCRHVEFAATRDEGMMRLVRELKPERVLVFLPDEDHGKKHSIFAPFFNVQKATLNTPARMSRLSDADCYPMLASYDKQQQCYRIDVGACIHYDKQARKGDFESKMNHGFETLIRQNPAQYLWLLKLFKTQPDTEEKRY